MERVDRLTKRLRQRRAVGGRRRRRGEEEVEVAGSDEVEETKRLEVRALKGEGERKVRWWRWRWKR